MRRRDGASFPLFRRTPSYAMSPAAAKSAGEDSIMPAEHFFAEDPREVGLDPAKVEALFIRAEREIKDGLLPSSQIAIARKGKIAAMRTVGHAVQGGADKPATNETVYCIFSCTKAIMSSAVWLLMQDGKLDPSEKVADT